MENIVDLIRTRIESLRPKLLDLSRRNPLISTKFSTRSNSYIRVVDELPDVLYFNLSTQNEMRLVALPSLGEDPRDELVREFQDALSNARLTDQIYLDETNRIDASSERSLDLERKAERSLRDRVRALLGMSPRQNSADISLPQHAKNNHISPSFELPEPTKKHEDGRHDDRNVQTLLLPESLERKANGIISKCRTWSQETGINVLHAAFGFLEWTETESSGSSLAPLLLMPIVIEKKKTREGAEFWLRGLGDEAEVNPVFSEKLQRDFGIEMPAFNGSVEEYMATIRDHSPNSLEWRVRRQVAFGVFPSARMAMHRDLDTSSGAFDAHPVVVSIFGGNSSVGADTPFADEYEIDRPDIEKKVPYLILDADSSQFSVLVDVADGKNLAIEGPPGTGKSQTIVNTIASALADGKKVLFVAEKTAALNIVRSRLDAVGLGGFILELQAGRSTREQVVKSIKDRMEISVPRRARDYDSKIDEFRSVRDQISEYINVISMNFEETGLTVHEILGKSISTAHRLEKHPRSLKSTNLPGIESFKFNHIGALKQAADEVEQTWRQGCSAKEFWRGLKLAGIDRLNAEQILELARETARRSAIAAEKRACLPACGLKSDIEPNQLKSIGQLFETLSSLDEELDWALIERICREERHEEFSSFLRSCKNVQKEHKELSRVIDSPAEEGWGHRLRQAYELCRSNQIKTLDLSTWQNERAQSAIVLATARKVRSRLGPFVTEWPESANWEVASIGKARGIVTSTPKEVLALRNGTRADADTAGIVEHARMTALSLRTRRQELETLISLNVSGQEVSTLILFLRGAGIFGFMSPTYRRAKNRYQELSLRQGFKRQLAVTDLSRLAEWLEETRRFSSDVRFRTYFGLQFQGIDTDFEAFNELTRFYRSVDDGIVGMSNRSLRRFLKVGDLDLLIFLPELEGADDEATFESCVNAEPYLEKRVAALDDAITQLESLTTGINQPEILQERDLPRLAERVDANSKEKKALEQNEVLIDLLGSRFSVAIRAPERLEIYRSAARDIGALQDQSIPVLRILEAGQCTAVQESVRQAAKADAAVTQALDELAQLTGISADRLSSSQSYEDLQLRMNAAADDFSGLQDHSLYYRARRNLDEMGCDWIVQAVLDAGGELNNLSKLIEAVFYRALASSVYARHRSTLSKFSGGKLNQLRERIASLDREIIEMSRAQVREDVHKRARPPRGNGIGRKSTWTERALLENEISKTKRFIPVRDLTRRAGRALLELKPCWMMSPLAVAQYISKRDIAFDLVIVDEASQMPPEDAVGALVRGKQAMVVGDTNQLPPTSFFKKLLDEEEADEDETVLNESILEMANAAFRPARRLRWHYRSRNSDLIKFSNHHVYGNDMIIFPSAQETGSSRAVSFEYVRGRYSSGLNVNEAKVMVEAILRFMRDHPDQSLGVVVLNKKQCTLMEEEWLHALAQDSSAERYVKQWEEKNGGLEEFFIKNLENVQGDERDVIFIGTVYGPSTIDGPVMQRFGPINGLAGKRRLNVLFSRAKHRIVTFSSMTSSDIKADEHGNPGAYMLKCWLEYSATGVLHAGETTGREPDSDFEIFVINQIQAMGCIAVPQVGVEGYFIDVGVKHPDWPHGYILGVECDGASYHSHKSARDRDRLRQEVLEGLGWSLYRIWSTDWFNDPLRESQKLREAIIERLKQLKENAPTSTELPVTTALGPQNEEHETKRKATPMQEWLMGLATPSEVVESRSKDNSAIEVGDRVRVRYISDAAKTLEVTLSENENAPDKGIVSVQWPLGQALLGAHEGDEIEVLIGSYVRKAEIEKVYKMALV